MSSTEQSTKNLTNLYGTHYADCFNVSAESKFSQILNGGVTTTFVCFGFVINIFVIVILRSLRRRSIQNYLIALAVWDNLLLLSAFFLYSLSTLLYQKRTIDGNYVHIYPVAYTISNVSLMGTLWMIVALTIDRYRFIVDPIRFRVNPLESGDSRCTFILILILSLFALSLGIPHLFEMTFTQCVKPDGTVVPMIMLTSLRNNQLYKIGYRVIGGLLFQSLVPVTLLAYLMGRISMELYRARLRRRKMSSPGVAPRSPSRHGVAVVKKQERVKKKRENSDNLMLLCVVFKFLLTRSLPLALDVTETVLEHQFNRIPFIALLVNISNALVVINSATNFWVYLVVGVRFRQKCQSLLWKGVRRVSFRRSESSDIFPDDTSKDVFTSLGVSGSFGNSKRNSVLVPKESERLLSGPGLGRTKHSLASYHTILGDHSFHRKYSERPDSSAKIRSPPSSTSFSNQRSKRVLFSEEKRDDTVSSNTVRRKCGVQLRRSSSATTSNEQMKQFLILAHCDETAARAESDESPTYFLNCVTNAVA